MRTFIIPAAALLLSSAAIAQTPTTPSVGGAQSDQERACNNIANPTDRAGCLGNLRSGRTGIDPNNPSAISPPAPGTTGSIGTGGPNSSIGTGGPNSTIGTGGPDSTGRALGGTTGGPSGSSLGGTTGPGSLGGSTTGTTGAMGSGIGGTGATGGATGGASGAAGGAASGGGR